MRAAYSIREMDGARTLSLRARGRPDKLLVGENAPVPCFQTYAAANKPDRVFFRRVAIYRRRGILRHFKQQQQQLTGAFHASGKGDRS